MSECVSAHFIDDFAACIDEQRTLHIGARCDDSIMDAHSVQDLQGCSADIDLVAPRQQ